MSNGSDLQKVMSAYAAALKASDVETIVGLYSPKGVFMREEMKAVVGSDALRTAYKELFAALKLDLQFTQHEAEQAGDMGWWRGATQGTVKIVKSGAVEKHGYNLLVVFSREAGAWKIRAFLYGYNRPESGHTPT